MAGVTASVGIRNGKQCYNVVSDQLVVINLLNRLASFSGGTRDKPLSTSPQWGVCSQALYQAILNFQAMYSLSQDGHVDPGGITIRRMNQAVGDVLPGGDPSGGGKAAGGVVGQAALLDTWSVDNLSLNGYSYIDTVGGGLYTGNIALSRDSDGASVVYPITGGGPAAGPSVSLSKAVTGFLGPIGAKIANFIVNSGISAADAPSSTTGVCIPLTPNGKLEKNDFLGTMSGMFLSGNVLWRGMSGYTIFFGMPRMSLPKLIVRGNEFLPYYQAKGVANIGSGGIQGALSIGVSLNDFLGVIG